MEKILDPKEILSISGVQKCELVGSRFICEPPPEDTDEDWLVLIDPMKAYKVYTHVEKMGYVVGGSVEVDGEFNSYHKGEINLIITDIPFYFSRFLKGTQAAKLLGLRRKKDRVMLIELACHMWHVSPN